MSRTIKDILAVFPNTTKQDWKQHSNGKGWVKNTAHADASAFIESIVSGDAKLSGTRIVSKNAWVDHGKHSGEAIYRNERRVEKQVRVR